MLKAVTLTLSCLISGAAAWADEEPANALLPANGPVETVRAEKIVITEAVGPHDWLVKHATIVKLVDLTNQHRAQMGLGPVVLDTQMCLDAQRHATWMADFGGFQHSGLPYMEIIYQSVTTPEAAIQGWIASPPHHGIMCSGTRVGFGYMVRNGYPYWVGVFR
jgi:Cysteine-rich secretory protein family